MMDTLKRWIGLDIREDVYAYADDPRFGYTHHAHIPDTWVKTTCGYCSVGCGMLLGVKDNKVVTVRGDEDHPVNDGKLCPKGLSEHYFLTAANRARTPFVRGSDGILSPSNWEAAAGLFAHKTREIKEKYGPGGFAVLSTGQLVTEEFYTLGKLVRLGMGLSHYDGNTTLCMASAVAGYRQSFGSDGPPGSYKGLEEADLIFLMGANIADNHPILWHRLMKNENRTLIVTDPRKTKTAMFADLYLPVKPRGDIDLINGIIHLLIKWDAVDHDFIRRHTTGFEALKKHSRRYVPALVARRTGIPPEVIERTARLIADSKNAYFAWTMGVNHSTQGTDTVSLINTLALITGNIGRTGAAPMSITGQCNAMGTREFGFTASMPGYRKYDSAKDRAELASLYGMQPMDLPAERGRAYPDIIDGILDGTIRGLWIIGTNPVVSFPDRKRLEKALSGLDFLVVQDGFHPTPTSEFAHLVLPAGMWGEKDGSYTNSERRASRVRAGTKPPGDAKSDFDIFLALSRALGVDEKLFPGWTSPADAFEEMRKVSRGRLCDYSGMTYEKMEKEGGLQWPCNDANPGGADSLYSDAAFQTEDKRAKLFFVKSQKMPERTTNSFPLILNTGRTVEHWHTRTKTGVVPLLEKLAPTAWVEIHPKTAAFYEIGPRDKVSLRSVRGRVENLIVRVTETIQPGHVFVPFHFIEKNANDLTLPAFDPKSREPNYKQCAVQIEKMKSQRTRP